ncbi:hypothetical protein CYY_001980 [Polysphondylium violaceum]|uniref:RNase P protein subunit n=1 Tax=Polysphondylium violaceum TaxID=133409 RepID=A0A8J4V3C5_9MYCE|nr:hypothetical protein CYY_001980 [Polysphondylium violaceum]
MDTKKSTFIVPRTLDTLPFVKARKNEINQFIQAIKEKKSNARAFQSLPRYLRRRTMSHNIYRLPIYLRKRAQREIELSAQNNKKGVWLKEKKPVRRSKRRPAYLLRNYIRRQKKYVWLETHIWHAKRMNMLQLWNHKIARAVGGKAVRSTFRASAHLCTLYDCSYYTCIQITGMEKSIVQLFSSITDPGSISIENKAFLSGSREGNVHLYYPNRFPYHFICPANFLWRQEKINSNNSSNNKERMLWIWIHPAALKEVVYVFEKESSKYNVKIQSLDQQLQRFELTGSKSHHILNSIIHINSSKSTATPSSSSLDSGNVWNALNGLRTPATLPKGTVISLDVLDPRLYCRLPQEIALQTKNIAKPNKPQPQQATPTPSINQVIVNWNKLCNQVAVSDLWDQECRSDMTKRFESIQSVNQRRKSIHKNPNQNEDNQFSKPSIMLIQRDGGVTRGYGSGWDIVMPAGWAMAFWLPLIYAGAWAIGIQDRDRFLLEQSLPSFPRDYPDCKSHKEYLSLIASDKETVYKRTPKAKKPNFLNNRIFFPFSPSWEWILRYDRDEVLDFDNTEQEEQQVHKAEDEEPKHQDKKIKNILGESGAIVLKPQAYFVYRGKLALSILPSTLPTLKNNVYLPQSDVFNEPSERGLVRVNIRMLNRGKPLPNSVIFEPLDCDVELLKNQYLLKKDYRCKENENIGCSLNVSNLDQLYDNLPRKPIGFICNGEQSLIRGNGSGVGYCSAVEFVKLHNRSLDLDYSPSGFAFIQNTKSKMIYPVILTIQP